MTSGLPGFLETSESGASMRQTGLARVSLVAGSFLALTLPASAYTTAGDRGFPATILLPQIAPSDEFYATVLSQPSGGGARDTNFSAVYDKSITDRFGVFVSEVYTISNPGPGPNVYGWQNTTLAGQYTAVIDAEHEFLASVGLQRAFGRSGAARVGASTTGATQPFVTFGKGLGDLNIGYLRPLAISGFLGYQVSDNTSISGDQLLLGAAVEYSVPYLNSKVSAVNLPGWVRSLTPIVEFSLTSQTSGAGAQTSATLGPGISSTGEGWDFGIEALVPVTRSAGKGLGIAVQIHLSLDYLFPETIGKPLFGSD